MYIQDVDGMVSDFASRRVVDSPASGCCRWLLAVGATKTSGRQYQYNDNRTMILHCSSHVQHCAVWNGHDRVPTRIDTHENVNESFGSSSLINSFVHTHTHTHGS